MIKNPISTLVIFCLFSSIVIGQKDNCLHKISESDWNISVCIDSSMRMELLGDEIVVKQHLNESNQTSKLSILINYNSDKLTSKDLWNKDFKPTCKSLPNSSFISDSSYLLNGNEVFSSFYKGNKNGENLFFANAIIRYKEQYYQMSSTGIDAKETFTFFNNILRRLEFFGETKLKDDKRIKEQFFQSFKLGLKDANELKTILLSFDLMMDTAPVEEKDNMPQDQIEFFKNMIQRWNQSAIDFSKNFSDCTNIEIVDKHFKIDNSQQNVVGYSGTMTFKCDEQKKFKVKLLSMEIKGKMYLGMVVEEK